MTWTESQWVIITGLHTASEANVPRGGKAFWTVANAAKEQRATVTEVLRGEWPVPPMVVSPKYFVVVSLTRISPSALDGDNLQSALKHVRDGVADWLGVDDRSSLIRWDYAQQKGAMGVRIEVTPVAHNCTHCNGKGWVKG